MISGVSLPLRRRDWRLMGRTTRLVLSSPAYAGFATLMAVVSLSAFVFPRNFDLLTSVVLSGTVPLGARLTLLLELYPGIGAGYATTTSVLLVAVAVLVGVDFALVAYYLREHEFTVREGTGSLTSVVLGTLGAGCASCGSAVLAGLLSFVGVGGSLTVLPLDGAEFLLVALVSVVFSIFWIARGLEGAEVRGCPVEVGGR